MLLQEWNKFCDNYKNVEESDINEEQSKLLYSYFGALNDVLMQFKTMFVELDVKHSGVKTVRENVNKFNKYLTMGKSNIDVVHSFILFTYIIVYPYRKGFD